MLLISFCTFGRERDLILSSPRVVWCHPLHSYSLSCFLDITWKSHRQLILHFLKTFISASTPKSEGWESLCISLSFTAMQSPAKSWGLAKSLKSLMHLSTFHTVDYSRSFFFFSAHSCFSAKSLHKYPCFQSGLHLNWLPGGFSKMRMWSCCFLNLKSFNDTLFFLEYYLHGYSWPTLDGKFQPPFIVLFYTVATPHLLKMSSVGHGLSSMPLHILFPWSEMSYLS